VSLVSEIGDRLSSQSVGGLTSTATWRIAYNEFLPSSIGSSSQAQQIAVTPTGGFPEEAAEAMQRKTFQMKVRCAAVTSSTVLDDKMDNIDDALNLKADQTWNSRKYVFVQKQGDRLYLGRDSQDRPEMVQNYVAFRSRT